MEDSFGGMFKLTNVNYSVWKSKMRDVLVCKDLWLSVQYDKTKLGKIDALTWQVLHMKETTYIRCFIDMGLYNFNEETNANVLWMKIWVMFENKNAVNRVSAFRKIVRLRYQDGASMAEHLNAFKGLINQTTSLEVPLADKVLALLLLGSLPDNWETLVVSLGNGGPHGKQLSLEMVKSSLLNEEVCRNDRESIFNHKVLVTEGDSYKGRARQRSPQNRD